MYMHKEFGLHTSAQQGLISSGKLMLLHVSS